jgi:hypothetical protein
MKIGSLVGQILGRIIVVEKESLSSILLRTATSSQTQSQFEKGRNDGVECCRVYDLLPSIADERQCKAGSPTNQSPNSGLRAPMRTLARCTIASYVLSLLVTRYLGENLLWRCGGGLQLSSLLQPPLGLADSSAQGAILRQKCRRVA